MSQTEIPSSAANITRTNWSEITPQHLYDKCMALARNLWWSWHPEVVNLFREDKLLTYLKRHDAASPQTPFLSGTEELVLKMLQRVAKEKKAD